VAKWSSFFDSHVQSSVLSVAEFLLRDAAVCIAEYIITVQDRLIYRPTMDYLDSTILNTPYLSV